MCICALPACLPARPGQQRGVQGLGEMMPEQLWHTTLDPQRRLLRRLTLSDAAEAAHLFSLLMGSQVPPPFPLPCSPQPL